MSSFWDKEEELSTVEKNKSENIVAKRCTKGDKTYIDIRISKVDKEGEYHPTSKGVAIPENLMDDLFAWR